MMTATQKWLYGLASTLINGVASGIVLIIVSPDTFNFQAGWKPLLTASAALGLLGMANYLKSSPLPSWDDAKGLLIGAVLGSAVAFSACGGKPVILVAQAGQTLAGSIGQAQRATTSLMNAGVITPAQARAVHVTLLQANDKLKPLPDLLLAIDAATQAGQSDAGRIAAALQILQAVGVDLDSVVAGLPVGQTAGQVLQAVTEARKLIAQITAALAKRHAAVIGPLVAAPAAAGGA